MALTTVELFREPGLMAEARRELARRVGGRSLSPPRSGDFDVMTEDPAAFWNATWRTEDPPG